MISMIVVIDNQRGIGKENQLLTHLSEDLKYFKRITEGHPVIMGYNTYLSLPFKPLKNRINVVLSRQNREVPGCELVHSIEEILEWHQNHLEEEVFIIGGASLYEEMLPHADKLYITHIFHQFEADTYFPNLSEQWKVVSTTSTKESLEHKYPHVWAIYEKETKEEIDG